MDNADKTMLHLILDQLNAMGVGKDKDINGGDAVDYLNELRDDLRAYLKIV